MKRWMLLPLLFLAACAVSADDDGRDADEMGDESTDTAEQAFAVGTYVGVVAGYETWCRSGYPLQTTAIGQHCPAVQHKLSCKHIYHAGVKIYSCWDYVRYGTYAKENGQKYFDSPGAWFLMT